MLNEWRSKACNLVRVIPVIDIWRAANLMLKRYGDKALEESAARADELAAQDDYNGATVWRRIADAVGQLANQIPPGPLQYPRHFAATLTRIFASNAICGVKLL